MVGAVRPRPVAAGLSVRGTNIPVSRSNNLDGAPVPPSPRRLMNRFRFDAGRVLDCYELASARGPELDWETRGRAAQRLLS